MTVRLNCSGLMHMDQTCAGRKKWDKARVAREKRTREIEIFEITDELNWCETIGISQNFSVVRPVFLFLPRVVRTGVCDSDQEVHGIR